MPEFSKQKPTILIIDDDDQVRKLLEQLLAADNDCTTVDSAEAALTVLDITNFSLVISDIDMKGVTGLELVPLVLKRNPETVVIIVSGLQTIDYAIEAMRVVAFDYITKPLAIRHTEA